MSGNSSDSGRDVGQPDGEAHDLNTEFLDDTSDTHAAMFGFWDGLKAIDPRPGAYAESQKEPHYYKLGYVLGYLLKVALLAAGVHVFGGVPA